MDTRFRIVLLIILASTLAGLANASDLDPMKPFDSIAQSIYRASEGRVTISGYVNGHYMNHDGVPKIVGKNLNKPLFQIREASLFADITMTGDLVFSTELETSYDFSSKSSSGREDRFKALFNYYYIDYDIASAANWDTDVSGSLSIRFGRILVPFLSYNENKPSFRQFLMSQPFTAWQLAPAIDITSRFHQFGWTDTGISINWSRTLGGHGLFDLKISAINGLASNQVALDSVTVQLNQPGMIKPTIRPRDGLGATHSDWDNFKDNNSNKAVVLKASYAPFSVPLNFGISLYKGTWDKANEQQLTMKGVHLNYLHKSWTLKGEFVQANVEQIAGLNLVLAPGPIALNQTTGNYALRAWYIEGSYVAYRYGENESHFIRLITRFDDVDTNNKAEFTPFDRSRITLGLEWSFLKNMRLRYESQKHRIHSFDKAPAPYLAAGGKESITMNMLSLIAYF